MKMLFRMRESPMIVLGWNVLSKTPATGPPTDNIK
jgi:hypothetical protein